MGPEVPTVVDAIEITEAVDSQDLPRAVQDAVVVEECPACGTTVPARVIGTVSVVDEDPRRAPYFVKDGLGGMIDIFGGEVVTTPSCTLCGREVRNVVADRDAPLRCHFCTELERAFFLLRANNPGAAAIWLLQKVSGR